MTTYSYRARDVHGSLITGHSEAVAETEILKRLTGDGLIPISIKKVSLKFSVPSIRDLFRARVKTDELVVFTRQFLTLFKAGLGMDTILTALIRQCRNRTLADVLKKIRLDVASGSTLAKSFSKYPHVFRDYYVNMLQAGEEAGILDKTLDYLCALLDNEREIRSSVKSATLYPKIVVGVLVAATSVLMTFVVPKFAQFYGTAGVALPLPTVILMKTSYFFVNFWHLMGFIFLGGYLLFRWYRSTARGGVRMGRLGFKMPVFGPLELRATNARFCHILSALYKSGLPITRALEITAGVLENGAFRQDVDRLRSELVRGRGLAESMAYCRYFLAVVQEAVAAGEKSGSLDEMLESIGNHYDTEVRHSVKNLSTLLEPFLLVLVFGMVGLFALAIFLPIWNMSQLAGR